jgi:methyl-accepting chemotaxis protein
VRDIDKQNNLEELNLHSCGEMSKAVENLLEFTQEFENIISDKLTLHCKTIAENVSKSSYSNDQLREYAEISGISEFYITDEDGVTVLSNNPLGIGFRFPEDEDSQAHVFRKILRDNTAVISQNFMKRDIDDKYYKFVAISRTNNKFHFYLDNLSPVV